MSLCLGQRVSFGIGQVIPKPQDACALPRKTKCPAQKKTEPRDQQFNLSLTASELADVKRRAEALGLRPVHFGRLVILDQGRNVASRSTPSSNIDRLIHGQLIRLGNNLNQLTRRFHASGPVAVPADLEPLLRDIRSLIARMAP